MQKGANASEMQQGHMKQFAKRQARPSQPWAGIVPGRLGGAEGAARSRHRIFAKSVAAFVPQLTRKAFERFGFSTATLIMDWERIAGPEVARMAVPERVKWPHGALRQGDTESPVERGAATLVLRVDPAFALEVEYRSRQILERVNSYFGYRAIADLRLLQAPIPRAARPADVPQQAIPRRMAGGTPAEDKYGDEPLGRALARLEAGVRRRAALSEERG